MYVHICIYVICACMHCIFEAFSWTKGYFPNSGVFGTLVGFGIRVLVCKLDGLGFRVRSLRASS